MDALAGCRCGVYLWVQLDGIVVLRHRICIPTYLKVCVAFIFYRFGLCCVLIVRAVSTHMAVTLHVDKKSEISPWWVRKYVKSI
jgi:hypothetical protein